MRRWAIAGLCVALAGCGGADSDRPRDRPQAAAAVVREQRIGPRVLDLTVRSPALGRTAKVRLLEPDRGARPWPVLYLLHGCCDSYISWTRSTRIEQMAPLRRALVVMPEGGEVGFYSDWKDGPGWETFHTRELPALLRRYGAGSSYSVAGLSMGGLGAMAYAARHPRLFRAAASFSGVLHPLSEPSIWQGLVGGNDPNPDGLWGDPIKDRATWAAHDPTELAGRLRDTRLYVASGDGQGGSFDGTEATVGAETRAFADRLRELGIPFRAHLYRGGRHDWPYWERDLRRALPVLLSAPGSGR